MGLMGQIFKRRKAKFQLQRRFPTLKSSKEFFFESNELSERIPGLTDFKNPKIVQSAKFPNSTDSPNSTKNAKLFSQTNHLSPNFHSTSRNPTENRNFFYFNVLLPSKIL